MTCLTITFGVAVLSASVVAIVMSAFQINNRRES